MIDAPQPHRPGYAPPAGSGPLEGLLARYAAGDRVAFDELFGLVYGELRRVARQHLRVVGGGEGRTLNTTGLVHESYLKLAGGSGAGWRDRVHFFAVASTAMRQILVDHARRRSAVKRGGNAIRITLDDRTGAAEDETAELLALEEALTRLGQQDARLERVVECRFFGGMSVQDTAHALGVSGRTVERDWQRAKTYLYHLLKPAA